MEIQRWNKETRQAYVGTLLYSLLGILAAILTPFVRLGNTAKALAAISGDSYGSGSSGAGIALSIIEIAIIFGYIIFFLAIKDLKSLTEGEEQKAFKRVYLSIIFDIIAAIFGIFHLGILCGILGLVSCFLLISAYSTLKSSRKISEFSTAATSGFSLLFTAEILILVAICIGWIPIIKIIGSILKAIAWLLVLLGWRKVAKLVEVPGEGPIVEQPMLDTFKEVISESLVEAKEVAKDAAEKGKIIADEVGNKAKEASESIKERIKEDDGKTIEKTEGADETTMPSAEKPE